MSEKLTNQGSLELSTKQQARFEKYFEVVPVSEAAQVGLLIRFWTLTSLSCGPESCYLQKCQCGFFSAIS
jgi:hypothetical protein